MKIKKYFKRLFGMKEIKTEDYERTLNTRNDFDAFVASLDLVCQESKKLERGFFIVK